MLARYRNLAVPLAVVAAVVLFYMENPWVRPGDGTTERQVATVAFWILAIVTLVLMFEDRKDPAAQTVDVEGPAFTRYLFSNTRAGLIWLPIRIFLGFSWLEAGAHKLLDGGWIDGGASLLAYWENAAAIPEAPARPAVSFEWYRTFLQFLIDNGAHTWFAWLITFGELAVGIGLLTGTLVGIAAFFGALMNMSFLLAGWRPATRSSSRSRSGSSWPGALPATTASIATCSRCSGSLGVRRWSPEVRHRAGPPPDPARGHPPQGTHRRRERAAPAALSCCPRVPSRDHRSRPRIALCIGGVPAWLETRILRCATTPSADRGRASSSAPAQPTPRSPAPTIATGRPTFTERNPMTGG